MESFVQLVNGFVKATFDLRGPIRRGTMMTTTAPSSYLTRPSGLNALDFPPTAQAPISGRTGSTISNSTGAAEEAIVMYGTRLLLWEDLAAVDNVLDRYGG